MQKLPRILPARTPNALIPRMRTLKTSEAAALLNVSPNTLRAWERRFEYPKPRRSAGGHRLYTHAEITALSDALREGLSISSAVSIAREALGADVHTLLAALLHFSAERADRSMETSIALRPIERSVEDVMLSALRELRRRKGVGSAAWSFGARWACEWLRRAQRLAPPPAGHASILLGDASHPELDPAGPAIRALELFCARAGARVLSLSVRAVGGLEEAVAAARPDSVVLAGRHAGDDEVAQWAYGVRSAAGPVPVALYHRRPDLPAGPRARVLSPSPQRAHHEALDLAEAHQARLADCGRPLADPDDPARSDAGPADAIRSDADHTPGAGCADGTDLAADTDAGRAPAIEVLAP